MIKLPDHSLLVFLTGAVILGIELTASRYMSPMFGSSLYIWGAILSVTLACLSAGYSWGGRLGARLENPVTRLILFVIVSAAWVGVIPLVQRPIAQLGLMLGPTPGPLFVMATLFAFPIFLLATATPLVFAENSKTQAVTKVSTLMGDLFAIGTIGSVFGALVTAYLIIPLLGLRACLFALSITMFVAAASYVMKGQRIKTATNAIILVAFSQLIYTPNSSDGFKDGYQLLHKASSQYGELSVVGHAASNSRVLLLDGISQNWVAGDSFDRSLFEYTDVIAGQLSQYPSSNNRVLIIGLGAGILTKNLAKQGYLVESVELDPQVLKLAKEYFTFPEELTVHLQDGRSFIEFARNEGQRYGAVILDVSGGGTQPAHILNVEAFQAINGILAPDGVLFLNQLALLQPGSDNLAIHTLASLQSIFTNVRGFDCYPTEPDDLITNLVIAASHVPPADPNFRSGVHEALINPNVSGARVISDNWNPADIWSIKVNAMWHESMIDWLGPGAVIPI